MAVSNSSTRVLLTGANGFIGLHTTLRLLELGYRVRATVRTEAHETNVRATLSAQVDTANLEFARADLLKDDGWQAAVHGCDSVIHTASPYWAEEPRDENELILPARDGTLRVLRAAQAEGIKRAVLLSSTVAVNDGHNGDNRTFTEADWTDLDNCHYAYAKSKTLAERAAWDFINGPENRSKMEMVAVNPPNVFGPVLDNHNHTSIEWYRTLMHPVFPGVSRTQINFVDVRDLVDILVKAMAAPAAAGKRFLLSSASIPLSEFAEILRQNFSDRGYRISSKVIPNGVIRLLALFMPKIKSVANTLNWTYDFSTEPARAVFGWQPRPYRQTIVDMAESLVKFGLV